MVPPWRLAFTFHFPALEKEMATHSSVLPWRIPGAIPQDGGAWWAAIYGVAQSRTQLKRLSSISSSRAPRKRFRVASSPVQSQGSGSNSDSMSPETSPRLTLESDVLWTFKSTESLNMVLLGEGQETERPLSAICSLKNLSHVHKQPKPHGVSGGGFRDWNVCSYFPKISNEP